MYNQEHITTTITTKRKSKTEKIGGNVHDMMVDIIRTLHEKYDKRENCVYMQNISCSRLCNFYLYLNDTESMSSDACIIAYSSMQTLIDTFSYMPWGEKIKRGATIVAYNLIEL